MIHLMNSAVMPCPGHYDCRPIHKDTFFETLKTISFKSYVGYPQNARIISEQIGKPVPLSREDTILKDGDIMLVMKLKYRPKNKQNFNAKISDFEFFKITYNE